MVYHGPSHFPQSCEPIFIIILLSWSLLSYWICFFIWDQRDFSHWHHHLFLKSQPASTWLDVLLVNKRSCHLQEALPIMTYVLQLASFKTSKKQLSQVPVAHACNPSYSGGRDQEDHSLNPACAKVHETLSQKTLHKNRADGVAQGEDPVFKPQ
jgi:hypothetical protein